MQILLCISFFFNPLISDFKFYRKKCCIRNVNVAHLLIYGKHFAKRKRWADRSLRARNVLRSPYSVEIRTVLGFSTVLAAVLDEFRLV